MHWNWYGKIYLRNASTFVLVEQYVFGEIWLLHIEMNFIKDCKTGVATATPVLWFLGWCLHHQDYTDRYDGRHTTFLNTIWMEKFTSYQNLKKNLSFSLKIRMFFCCTNGNHIHCLKNIILWYFLSLKFKISKSPMHLMVGSQYQHM